jgi:hypothetical protein
MEFVAVAGFVLSIVALLWNLVLTFMRWPRVSVQMNQGVEVGAPGTPSRTTVRLVVVNHGAEPVMIRNLGIRSPDRSITLDYEGSAQYKPDRVPTGQELPARVDGHGVAVWTYSNEQLADFPRGTKMIGYAYRYRSFRLLPSWPVSANKPGWVHRFEAKAAQLRVSRRMPHLHTHETRQAGTKN